MTSASSASTPPPPAPQQATIKLQGHRMAPEVRQQFGKTQMCRFYKTKCMKGPDCPFAHGPRELKERPNLAKTSICQFYLKRCCPKTAEECRFAHGRADLRETAEYWAHRSSSSNVQEEEEAGKGSVQHEQLNREDLKQSFTQRQYFFGEDNRPATGNARRQLAELEGQTNRLPASAQQALHLQQTQSSNIPVEQVLSRLIQVVQDLRAAGIPSEQIMEELRENGASEALVEILMTRGNSTRLTVATSPPKTGSQFAYEQEKADMQTPARWGRGETLDQRGFQRDQLIVSSRLGRRQMPMQPGLVREHNITTLELAQHLQQQSGRSSSSGSFSNRPSLSQGSGFEVANDIGRDELWLELPAADLKMATCNEENSQPFDANQFVANRVKGNMRIAGLSELAGGRVGMPYLSANQDVSGAPALLSFLLNEAQPQHYED